MVCLNQGTNHLCLVATMDIGADRVTESGGVRCRGTPGVPLHRDKDDSQATDGRNVRGNEDRILSDGSCDKCFAAGKGGRNVLPRRHDGRRLKLDGDMVEIAQAIERVPFRVDSNDLMAWCLAWCRDNLDAAAQIAAPVHKVEEPEAMEHSKGVTFN